jgi:hypothetical protein
MRFLSASELKDKISLNVLLVIECDSLLDSSLSKLLSQGLLLLLKRISFFFLEMKVLHLFLLKVLLFIFYLFNSFLVNHGIAQLNEF